MRPVSSISEQTASRTLGELCRRLGDNVLDSVLPILRDASAGNTKTREGVCRAYIEIMRNSDEEQLEGQYVDRSVDPHMIAR